jgi:hypothetical protein
MVIGKIVVSSVVQQFINAGLSVIKLRFLYEALPPVQVGKFAVYTSMFFIVQFVFDSSRKSILSRVSPDDAVIGNEIVVDLIKRNLKILISIATFICAVAVLGVGKTFVLDFNCVTSVFLTILAFSFLNLILSKLIDLILELKQNVFFLFCYLYFENIVLKL